MTPLGGKYLELLKQKSFSILRSRFLKNPVIEEFTIEKLQTLWEKEKKALGVLIYELTNIYEIMFTKRENRKCHFIHFK